MKHSAALILLSLATSALADNAVERVRRHTPRMSFLDNGTIRLGVDLNVGGAITHISRSDRPDQNVVNSHDFGRQIQMSYYSGPVPFTVPGKQPKPDWKFIGWNPIQVGDAFGNASKLLDHANDGKRLYVKCVPMHWPLDNVPGECTYECWFELDGPAVIARSRIVNDRSADKTQYPARHQELPAIYTNGPWHRLITYTGDRPFTGGQLSRIAKKKGDPGMWSSWIGTESWAALVDDNDFGVGVWMPGVCQFQGGFAGKPGAGGPQDNPTGYISPTPKEIIDWNIAHEYRYELIVGTLAEIRKRIYARADRAVAPPAWNFDDDRQGWTYVNATDTGWPIKSELNVSLQKADPQLHSPVSFWRAEDAGTLIINVAAKTTHHDARIFWRGLQDADFSAERSIPFELVADGRSHTTRVKLDRQSEWQGAITQIRIDPESAGASGDWIRIASIRLEK
jgi:hypothetical protein